jgi:hypothetical protein
MTQMAETLSEFYQFVGEADAGLRGQQAAEWLDRTEMRHEQLNATLRECVAEGRVDRALEVAGAVWPFWLHRSHIAEGREWLAELLGDARGLERTAGRARALSGAGNLAFSQADHAAAKQLMWQSLDIYESLGDEDGIAEANSGLSRIAMAQGRPDLMRRHSLAALAVARRNVNAGLSAIPLHHLAHAALMEGDLEEADRLYEANIHTYRAMGREELVITELHNLGHVACLRCQTVRAKDLFVESLRRGEETGNDANRPYNLIGLGRVALAEGQPEKAAVLLNSGLAILKQQGKAVAPLLREPVEGAVADTKAVMGEEAYAIAAALGERLTVAEALRMVA